jgi:hypothetical protein
MLGALPTVGKLGLIAIYLSPEAAKTRYDITLGKLDRTVKYG